MTARRKRLLLVLPLVVFFLAFGQFGCRQYWEDQAVYAGWQVQEHVPTGFCRLLDRSGAQRASGRGDSCHDALKNVRAETSLRPSSDHLVILIHGLGRTPVMFRPMEAALRGAGYETVAISYPSLSKEVGDHAAQLERLLNGLEDVERVSFVTHSLGALVLRETLARPPASWRDDLLLGRAVMLAPPNQGADMALSLEGFGPFRFFGGPSADQLARGRDFAAPTAALEFGIIAGGTAGGSGYNPLLQGNDDGLVRVAETHLAGSRDSLVVPVIHTLIAAAPETIAATLKFLASGRFS